MRAGDLARYDLTRLLRKDNRSSPLRAVQERAEAQVAQFTPMTVEDRLAAFRKMGYRPHGIYLPNDEDLRAATRERLQEMGNVEQIDDRLRQYFEMQEDGERLEREGVAGSWTGQIGVARSRAQFRIVAWGRRSGKTNYAAHEAVATMILRPRSTVWCAAPTMKHVSRAFNMVEQILLDLGYTFSVHRNTEQAKLIVLRENGARVEGISLDNTRSAAGMAVDFVAVDEAADVPSNAWYRSIYPTLADRQGQALLISSWEGESNFFFEQTEIAREEASRGGVSDWELFQSASWDINFYQFPQGRRSPRILHAERNTPPEDFLEQFGAIPARAKNVVYPEFKQRIHVGRQGEWDFNKDKDVVLTVDPSGGANPYAVLVIQEYDGFSVVIDEFYEAHMTVEEISPILDRRPWRDSVTDVIVDSAMPAEIERWIRLKWPAYPVPDKPKVRERIPFYRNLLRNPLRFHEFYRTKMNELLGEIGLGENADFDMEPERQRAFVIQVEERLSDNNLTDQDIIALRGCSAIFYRSTCVNAIREHRLYVYPPATKRRKTKEDPVDKHNDALDAVGYYAWTRKRFDLLSGTADQSYIRTVGSVRRPQDLPRAEDHPSDILPRGELFIRSMRERYGPTTGDRSYIRPLGVA